MLLRTKKQLPCQFLIICLVSMATAFVVQADMPGLLRLPQPALNEPSAQNLVILADNKHQYLPPAITANQHPRLFFTASEIAALQTKAATTHQEIWLPIKEYTDSELGFTPPAQPPADSGVTTYRNYGNMLISFAFTCVITGQSNHCGLAKTYLLTYAGWNQWGEQNYRDLGHAHMLLGNAIAYDWLYNYLTPSERQIVRQSLADWAQKMYEASSGPREEGWSNWWRKSYMQNHHWINNSALGIAGLALLGEDSHAQLWVNQATDQMSRVQYLLNNIADGSWHEGYHYQGYGLTLSLPFIYNLKRIQGTEIIPDIYLQNYTHWRIYNHLPDTSQVILAYGDFEWDWGGYEAHNILRFIASEYGNGHAEWMAQQLIAADGRKANVWVTPWYVFEFFYYNPAIPQLSPVQLTRAQVFSDLEGVIWRTGWDSNDLIFALKTGAYGGRFAFDTFTQAIYPWENPCQQSGCQLNAGHGHDDMNGFYIYNAGHWLAPEREGVNQSSTSLHNTLLIDGQGQYRPADDNYDTPTNFSGSDGFLEFTANTLNFDYVAADATRRYKNIAGIEDITRHVLFVRPNYFIMLDNLAANAPHQYEWVSHFGQSVSVEGNWVRGNANSNQVLGVGVVSPPSFQTTTGNDGYPYVRIRPASDVANTQLIHLLYPTTNSQWHTRPAVSVTANTGETVVLNVQLNDGSNRRDDVILTYNDPPISSAAISVPYDFNGNVAVVSKGPGGTLQRLFVFGAASIKDQTTDTMLVSNLNPEQPFEAIYSGQTVAVSGSISTEIVLYAPQVEILTVNSIPMMYNRSGDFITISIRPIYLPIIIKDG